MANENMSQQDHQHTQRTLSRSRWVFIGFMLVIGYFLYAEHRAHVVQYLPYLLLLACPLMHVFMHRGHGHHDAGRNDNGKGEP